MSVAPGRILGTENQIARGAFKLAAILEMQRQFGRELKRRLGARQNEQALGLVCQTSMQLRALRRRHLLIQRLAIERVVKLVVRRKRSAQRSLCPGRPEKLLALREFLADRFGFSEVHLEHPAYPPSPEPPSGNPPPSHYPLPPY